MPSRLIIISNRSDVLVARQAVQAMAREAGFSAAQASDLDLACSELGSNLVRYAHQGTVSIRLVEESSRIGIEIVSADTGPGILDTEEAQSEGFSTGAGLGDGLAVIRRMVDEFSIESTEAGTKLVLLKWASPR